MVIICWFGGIIQSKQNQETGEDISGGLNGVGYQCIRMSENSSSTFYTSHNGVRNDA
jgi:hypothetical protein